MTSGRVNRFNSPRFINFVESNHFSTDEDEEDCVFCKLEECQCTDEEKENEREDPVEDQSSRNDTPEPPCPVEDGARSISPKKKKKRKKISTICTENCKYEVVTKIAKSFGMRSVRECDNWNLYWTDHTVTVERAKEMKRFQKVNHFPGMAEICRKDLLARNLNRMLKLFPKDYNFFPKTWCLPADLGEVIAYSKSHPNKTFILKPDVGCQGKGIYLTKNVKDVKPYERMICQVYIHKPFLIDGFKFDMRIYALVTCVDPLRIFVYNDGLARFATSRYKEPAGHNTTNIYMHLTNYSLNKHSRMYVVDDEAGSKRRLSTLNQHFEKLSYDVERVWAAVDDAIVKTILAAHPVLKHSYKACFPSHDFLYACFELLGFDILLDYRLKPYILEVNHSPSFHTDARLDAEVKESLLEDTFRILNLAQCHRKRAVNEDRQRIYNRLMQTINSQTASSNTLSSECAAEMMNSQWEWESTHMGNYRQIYPSICSDQYQVFFEQNQSSVFQETFASKAREEASRLQREEFEAQKTAELSRRVGHKEKKEDDKSKLSQPSTNAGLRPESPQSAKKQMPLENRTGRRRHQILDELKQMKSKRKSAKDEESLPTSDSQECSVVVSPRRKKVYQMMKQAGNIRVPDMIKYGIYEKSKKSIEFNELPCETILPERKLTSLIRTLPKIRKGSGDNNNDQIILKSTVLQPPWVFGNDVNSNDDIMRLSNSKWSCMKPLCNKIVNDAAFLIENKQDKNLKQLPDLKVTCNEAAIFTRPNLPGPTEWPSTVGARSTRSFIARHFSNTLKLQDLESRLNYDRDTKSSIDRNLSMNNQMQSTL
ncbi:hypothetical protein LSTR_LSTR008407 [Laodelphax striatellus]|uniref:Uncharacterized protein n=1 Tax=Laodelphax striatellus TaxID=195883 RepID=A0A482XYL8_LAOST|nr:hypothetical protein LSTR_LSTR008407 [Laodelphax striatellus]